MDLPSDKVAGEDYNLSTLSDISQSITSGHSWNQNITIQIFLLRKHQHM